MGLESMMDIALTVVFVFLGFMFIGRYRRQRKILFLALAVFFLADAFGFTVFDVSTIGINAELYGLAQMLASYLSCIFIAIVMVVEYHEAQK